MSGISGSRSRHPSVSCSLVRYGTKLITAAVTLACVLLIAVCCYMSFREKITGELMFFLGYKPVYVESGSMEPALKTGEIVLFKQCNYDEIREGDVILFRTAQGYVTHRLVGVDANALREGNSSYLITKGDANPIEDPFRLDPDHIEGRMVRLWN